MSMADKKPAEEQVEFYTWISSENETYQWNITAMLEAAADSQPGLFPLSNYPLSEEWFDNHAPNLNREYALHGDGTAVDVTRPVLVVVKNGYPILVDGWHRMYRTWKKGFLPVVPCYVIPFEEAQRFRVQAPVPAGLK